MYIIAAAAGAGFCPDSAGMVREEGESGGAGRDRTADGSFAGFCLTTWPPRLAASELFRCYREPRFRATLKRSPERTPERTLMARLNSRSVIGKVALIEFAAVIAALFVLIGQPAHGAAIGRRGRRLQVGQFVQTRAQAVDVLGQGDQSIAERVLDLARIGDERSEERRVGKECRSRW